MACVTLSTTPPPHPHAVPSTGAPPIRRPFLRRVFFSVPAELSVPGADTARVAVVIGFCCGYRRVGDLESERAWGKYICSTSTFLSIEARASATRLYFALIAGIAPSRLPRLCICIYLRSHSFFAAPGYSRRRRWLRRV